MGEGRKAKGKRQKGAEDSLTSLRGTDLRLQLQTSTEAISSNLDNILVWQNSHSCHKNAVKLAGGTPVFYEIEKNEEWGIYGETPPDLIEEKLKTQNIKAVIVTSPTYEGVVSDINSISKICKKYGAYLIVDEAHGALYSFCEKLPTSAIYQGADFVIQSLHKTAGGLNPTALLHCNIQGMNIDDSLNLISTTSPSYPLLATIEKNINFLNSKKGRKHILKLIENIEKMEGSLPNCEFYGKNLANILSPLAGEGGQSSGEGYDPTKILVKVPNLNGFELSKILFEKYKIEDEITNEKSVMLLTGVGTDLKKLKRLEQALKQLSNNSF